MVDEELYRKVFEETVSSLDKRENASIPSVTVSKREVKECYPHREGA